MQVVCVSPLHLQPGPSPSAICAGHDSLILRFDMRFGFLLAMMFNTARMDNQTERKPTLDLIPNDVLVDLVFDYLELQDILAIRRVSKLYCHLTRQPIIWKRLLKRTKLLLPPLPPEANHELGNLKGSAAERFFMRAYEVDKAWREAHKQPRSTVWEFDAKGYVAEMALLPGGRYLVASVSDRDKWNWMLVLYAIRDRGPAEPLVAYKTESRALMLQAKFSDYKGKRGIAVSYLLRRWKHPNQDRHWAVNISDLGVAWESNPPFPMRYEVRTYNIALDVLEKAWDPDMSRQQWRDYAMRADFIQLLPTLRTAEKVSQVCLDTNLGKPFLAVAAGDDNIRIKPSGCAWVNVRLKPHRAHSSYPHHIKAIRPLPQQSQVLVVRVVDLPHTDHSWPLTLVELFDVPCSTTSMEEIKLTASAAQCSVANLQHTPEEVRISEPGTPHWPEAEARGRSWSNDEHGPLHPISIFFLHDSFGASRVTLYPKKTRCGSPQEPITHWRYDLTSASPLRREGAPTDKQRWVVIPGIRRTWFYATHWRREWRDWVDATYRYHDPETIITEDREEKPLPHRTVQLSTISRLQEMPCPLDDVYNRFEHIAFDETTGRMMFAKPDYREVSVVDLSRELKTDELALMSEPSRKIPKVLLGLGLGASFLARHANSLIGLVQKVIADRSQFHIPLVV